MNSNTHGRYGRQSRSKHANQIFVGVAVIASISLGGWFYSCCSRQLQQWRMQETYVRSVDLDSWRITYIHTGFWSRVTETPLVATMTYNGEGTPALKDADLSGISVLSNLRSLDISESAVTDATIELLASLRSLGVVNLSGSNITRSGVAELKGKRPDLRVIWGL